LAIDWVGIANGSHDEWRQTLADAAGTTADRVVVHALHQHDAPGADITAERLLVEYGLSGGLYNVAFEREARSRVAEALRRSLDNARPITHVGIGKAKVEKVASSRRVMGPDGKVQTRFS